MSESREKHNLKLLFDDAATDAIELYHKLGQLYYLLEPGRDQIACQRIMDDLIWAAENCSVIANHQIGKALNDPGAS